ncbi:LPS-assembly protein LptD [Devosia pacifica]|nr:LPS assembly protein LptD [Devosia pacifica]
MQPWGFSTASWLQRLALTAALAAAGVAPSAAQGLVPEQFFNAAVPSGSPTTVEADTLSFNLDSGVIEARGDVVLSVGGYSAQGAQVVYDRRSGAVRFAGPVSLRDPYGNIATGRDFRVTGGLREAFVESLTITTYDGARITADSIEYDSALRSYLTNATYAPCGDCIDEKGRKIGWSVRASRFVYNAEDNSVLVEQPTLELLGIPVAYLPYVWLPQATREALERIRVPSLDYSDETGVILSLPFAIVANRDTEVILSPTPVSGQGFLMGAEWIQRFDSGSFAIKASGIYQFDPEAFAGTVGDREWRGALQSAGAFTPAEDWTAGWSYTAFTDPAYLGDYRLDAAEASINQVFATHVSEGLYIDLRLQQFNELGDVTENDQDQQASALPNFRIEHVQPLGRDAGQIELSGRLLGVQRDTDDWVRVNGVDHVLGFEGEKYHAMLEGGWRRQFATPQGVLITPYLGARLDATIYEPGSALASAPSDEEHFGAAPVALLDMRWPWAGVDRSGGTHIVEPIVQLGYRGGESMPGIVNDDSQGLVLDETNVFSTNRFAGIDRQETGLRANIGGRYLADFADGSRLEITGGQSLQIAGENAFAADDPALPGGIPALDSDASYAVLGAKAYLGGGVDVGAKLQFAPDEIDIARAGLGARLEYNRYSADLDYFYEAANPAAGVLDPQHEIGAIVGVPISDYWTLSANGYWDLAANSWLQAGGGLQYDDGYLGFGAGAVVTGPTHRSPNDTRFTATFELKAPSGFRVGAGE